MRPEADISDFPTSGQPIENLQEARALIAGLLADNAGLKDENAELKARSAQLEGAVEPLRRSGKRQTAPFSKGGPSDQPARPGRKKGKGHDRHGHRMVPLRAALRRGG